jgi:signal transduction histidine kinase
MRGDFVENISHELRTPLAQMRVYLETLRLGRFTTDEQRAWSIANAERETRRLEHLVERVLRFSRSARFGDDDEPSPVDVAAETVRIVDEFRPLADARKAHIETDVTAVPSVALRPNALRHVLLNLLDNAVKYGPSGQTVRVRVHTLGDEVRIEVTDAGPGVPLAERESVWRAYRRGKTVGHMAGSGIGLAVVRDVVGQHAGRAWIADAPGDCGTRFVVAFPIAHGELAHGRGESAPNGDLALG